MSDNPYARPAPPADPAAAPTTDPSGATVPRRPTAPVRGSDQAVVVEGLSVVYGALTALVEVHCVVEPGTFLALTGPSGAGKTTLLWAIAGAVPAHTGRVVVRGNPISDRRSGVAADVAVIPQGNGLAGVLTAYENVVLPLQATGVPPDEAAARASSALADVGLEESGGHLVEELSGGQQQRVAVARGLAARTAVLLADEPTSELDQMNRGRVLELLQDAARGGAIVVMATHDPEAAAVAEGEIRLDEGRLAAVR